MKVMNVHKRRLKVSQDQVGLLLDTLSSSDDKIWPNENWPRMRLDKGLNKGSKGGHGPIRYTVIEYKPQEEIKFRFTAPRGFYGIHGLNIFPISDNETELIYTIDMHTNITGTIKWVTCIRNLHDALTQEAFDKMENHFSDEQIVTKYSLWVKLWRALLK